MLNTSKNRIWYIINNIDCFYRGKLQPKMKWGEPQKVNDTEKIRLIHAPVKDLKIIQYYLHEKLQQRPLPDCMFGSVKGSNHVLNALQHLGNKFFLTVDLRNFFTNIDNARVHTLFMTMGCNWKQARILTKLTTYKRSLPQGAPSSPMLANHIFAAAALKLQQLSIEHEITFTSFLDDLTFSSKNHFKDLVPDILRVIRDNQFYPNLKKIHYRKNTCEITGLVVSNNGITLPPEMIKRIPSNPSLQAYERSVHDTVRHFMNFITL